MIMMNESTEPVCTEKLIEKVLYRKRTFQSQHKRGESIDTMFLFLMVPEKGVTFEKLTGTQEQV